MSVRQYIGARYVPNFFNNPNNTSEWLDNVIYEPLTIVTYGLNSYTSKKLVPASIGNPADNPSYWVCTGPFNEQLAQCVNDINSLTNRIDNIVNLDIDSYLGSTYSEKLQNALNNFEGNAARIYLPEGVVYIGDVIIPAGKCFEFIGYGMRNNSEADWGTIIKPLTSDTQNIFIAATPHHDYCTFRNICFDGDDTCAYGLGGNYWGGTYIERCSFLNFAAVGANLKQGLNHVMGCYFKNPDGINMVLHSDSYVTNNEFSKAQTCAVIEAGGNRIIGNLFNDGAANGLELTPTPLTGETAKSCGNNIINSNYFGRNNGFDVIINGDSDYDCVGNVITANMFEMVFHEGHGTPFAEGGVKAEYNRQLNIVNNIFRGYADAEHNESILLNYCESGIISDNTFYVINDDAVSLSDVYDYIIDANFFRDINGQFLKGDKLARCLITNIKNQSAVANTGLTNSNSYGGNMFFNIFNGSSSVNYGSNASDKHVNIDDLLPFNEFNTLTFNVAATSTSSKITKNGGIVTINLDFVTTNAITTGNIFTIPTTYRPTGDNIGLTLISTSGHVMYVGIGASGTCYCLSGSLEAGDRVLGCLTYPI